LIIAIGWRAAEDLQSIGQWSLQRVELVCDAQGLVLPIAEELPGSKANVWVICKRCNQVANVLSGFTFEGEIDDFLANFAFVRGKGFLPSDLLGVLSSCNFRLEFPAALNTSFELKICMNSKGSLSPIQQCRDDVTQLAFELVVWLIHPILYAQRACFASNSDRGGGDALGSIRCPCIPRLQEFEFTCILSECSVPWPWIHSS
jgi:hypothetical protein